MVQASIRARSCLDCVICGAAGEVIYQDLNDALFAAPGLWSMRQCGNRSCQLIWLDPQPMEDDIGKAYSHYYTHDAITTDVGAAKRLFRHVRSAYIDRHLGYAGRGGAGARWMSPLASLTPGGGEAMAASVMFLPAPRGASNLLDVGCGSGDFLAAMRDLGWRVKGVETDPRAADIARQRGLDISTGDLQTAGFDGGSFDAVTMAHVIEHVHDAAAVVAECRRVLKPGGTLVILTPNGKSWGHRHFGRDWRGLEPPRHIRIFNRANMRHLLDAAGLTPVRVETLAINASASWSASAAIGRSRTAPNHGPAVLSGGIPVSGLGRQLAERVMLSFDGDAGEDLLAVATRSI